MSSLISIKQHKRGLALILSFGVLICIWQLGATGLFDETPPLFAAASRAMTETGDWLTPRVNGLPRYDKPPLVYWLMGFFYSLPGQETWDPLGTWSARLPSALSTLLMMIFIGDTVMKWPSIEVKFPRRTSVIASLAFALSPLVVIWSRIAVSDALLCSTLGISMILTWRNYVSPSKKYWLLGWIVLGLAILTKGPIALVISSITFLLFGFFQKDYHNLFKRIKPIKGILIAGLVSLPWYLLELINEGKPFWDSFFGYHNFQRLTSVVNSHSEPWWFFGFILIIASLPFTPFLILGIWDSLCSLVTNKYPKLPEESLTNFSACWLITILVLFTCAATKLPSYWLPATPPSAILVAITSSKLTDRGVKQISSISISSFIVFAFATILWFMHLWIYRVNDPEIPNLSYVLVSSKINIFGSLILASSGFIGIYLLVAKDPRRIILMQIPLVFFQLFFMLPLWKISDNLRQLPLRRVSKLILSSKLDFEPIAMVGINKPSLHFYTNKIIIYEKATEQGVINLAERLESEVRSGLYRGKTNKKNSSKTVLIVIDEKTSQTHFWSGLKPKIIGKYSIYNVWRIDRSLLDSRAIDMRDGGLRSDWQNHNPERI